MAEYAAGSAASLGNDPEQAQEIAARIWDRTPISEASAHQANQLGMVFSRIDCSPRWRERLRDLRIPSLIVHGRTDPFFPVGNGEALAAEIPEAQLLIHEGMGTQIPEWATADIATAMLRL